MLDRRDFVTAGTAAALAAFTSPRLMGAAAVPSNRPQIGGQRGTAAAGKVMPVVLSAKFTETGRTQTEIKNELTLEGFVKLTKDSGYDGIHLRASLAGIQTPIERLYEMGAVTKAAGLVISSVCPDFPVPINTDHAPDCLHNIGPYLAVADSFNCDMIRVGMKKEADIPWAQRAADEAKERRIRLVHHSEAGTLFETFDTSLKTLQAINRPNFGLMLDWAEWMANTPNFSEDNIVPNIKAVAPWIWEVAIKNVRPTNHATEIRLDASGGVNFSKVFEGLHAIGYKDYIQVHESQGANGDTPEAAAKTCLAYLEPFINRAKAA